MGLIDAKTATKNLGVWKQVGNFFTGWATSGFDKDPVYPEAPEAPWFKKETNVQNIFLCVWVTSDCFPSSYRKQQCGSLLWDMEVTSLIIALDPNRLLISNYQVFKENFTHFTHG